jgi:hypothetical protein
MIAPDHTGALTPEVSRVTRLDSDRAVAHVRVGPFMFSSIFVTGLADADPRVSWPRTSRGFKIIDVAEPARSDIEAEILRHVRECAP